MEPKLEGFRGIEAGWHNFGSLLARFNIDKGRQTLANLRNDGWDLSNDYKFSFTLHPPEQGEFLTTVEFYIQRRDEHRSSLALLGMQDFPDGGAGERSSIYGVNVVEINNGDLYVARERLNGKIRSTFFGRDGSLRNVNR